MNSSVSDRLAFCGQSGHISVELPFTEFLPKVQRVGFSAQVSNHCCIAVAMLISRSIAGS